MTSRFTTWAVNVGRLVFWPLLLLTIFVGAIETGVWTKEEIYAGPFAPDPFVGPDRAGVSVGFAIKEESPSAFLSVRSDENNNIASDLRLWINGREMLPAHVSAHDDIRAGRSTGFSFWNHKVIFALPADVANDATTKARVEYALLPPPGLALSLFACTAVLAIITYYRAISRFSRRFALRSLTLILLGLSGIYLASIVYAWMRGWAFPTTAIFRWSSLARWLARGDPSLSYALLIIAACGTVVSWLKPPTRDSVFASPSLVQRWFWPMAAVALSCLFVFSISAMWVGIVRPGDFHGANIGGLIAFNDSGGHVAAAYDQARDGVWSTFALRRPLAAAFRSVLLFASASSLPGMQILQIVVFSCSFCFATWSVARWRGPWVALIFFALSYNFVRTFVPTTLTEVLGLTWGYLVIPFLVEAFRANSSRSALLAFAFLVIGLMTRMGSMLTIPAFMLWLVSQFARTVRERFKIGAASAVILLGVFAFHTSLQNIYSAPKTIAGTNFAYTLCGLTIGTMWDGCVYQLEAAGAPLIAEPEVTKRLYPLAWENFKKQPSILFKTFFSNAWTFITGIPDLLFRGYLNTSGPNWLPRGLLLDLALFAAVARLRRPVTAGEASFWILFCASMIASAGIIYLDDGKRALAATYPLLFLLIAWVVSPAPVKSPADVLHLPDVRLQRWGISIIGGAALLLSVVPWLAHVTRPAQYSKVLASNTAPMEAIVLGGRRLTGFLIVADDAPLRHDIPTLHFSDFEQIVSASGVEYYHGLIHPERPPLPFGFIFAPRVEPNTPSDYQFIVPPDVLERKDVSAWRFHYQNWQPKPKSGNYWFFVTRAEPIENP
jgi:hypothetical protein